MHRFIIPEHQPSHCFIIRVALVVNFYVLCALWVLDYKHIFLHSDAAIKNRQVFTLLQRNFGNISIVLSHAIKDKNFKHSAFKKDS